MSNAYLAPGLPQPVSSPDGLDAPYWAGLRDEKILLQRCRECSGWQWGPEWLCHHCGSDHLTYQEVVSEAVIYSYERVWHPVHPALSEQGPYLIVLVELPQAGNVRLVGNLLGDPRREVKIGSPVTAVFEHHDDSDTPFTLLQWQTS